jgi:hypothetical protein
VAGCRAVPRRQAGLVREVYGIINGGTNATVVIMALTFLQPEVFSLDDPPGDSTGVFSSVERLMYRVLRHNTFARHCRGARADRGLRRRASRVERDHRAARSGLRADWLSRRQAERGQVNMGRVVAWATWIRRPFWKRPPIWSS